MDKSAILRLSTMRKRKVKLRDLLSAEKIKKKLKKCILRQNIPQIYRLADNLKSRAINIDISSFMHFALKYKRMGALAHLLELGGNVNMKNESQETVVEAAIKDVHCAESVVIMLLNKGANINDALDQYNVTLLLRAISYGKYAVAKHLVRMGADVHATDNVRKFSPLHLLNRIHFGKLSLIDTYEMTLKRMEELYDTLFQYGADVNQLDEHKQTPLSCGYLESDYYQPSSSQKCLLKHIARMGEEGEYISDQLKAEIGENFGFENFFGKCWLELRELKSLAVYDLLRYQNCHQKLSRIVNRKIERILSDSLFLPYFTVYGRDVKIAFENGRKYRRIVRRAEVALHHYIPKITYDMTESILNKLTNEDLDNLIKAHKQSVSSPVNPWSCWFTSHIVAFLQNADRRLYDSSSF